MTVHVSTTAKIKIVIISDDQKAQKLKSLELLKKKLPIDVRNF